MELNGDTSTDDYYVTAVQIFDYCGVNSSATLRVDELMDKFAPFIKTNKSECNYLKSLLDPEHSNPEITVTTLATTLNKYSENQKVKVDLDESFNLKSGQAPHDSDSGISTDGFQLLEELQCELKEKAHLAQQLRSQLDFTDRQHEEAISTITAERDSLRAHLNMLREENMTLSHVKRDYEEACDRLCLSERSLEEVKRELDVCRKRARVLTEQVASLETEKLTLQELLTKSKDECHRINEMYASRQSALLEENETLRTEHADVSTRLQDQEEFMQQIIKEKVLLEMELKDVFNKSNQAHQRMDRSIDISYTDDQMLTALDSLNADTRFTQENGLLDEESFMKALNEDQGRATNMSLFDEIRLSFCNISRHNITDINCSGNLERSCQDIGAQVTASTQTDDVHNIESYHSEANEKKTVTILHMATQTDVIKDEVVINSNNNNIQDCRECSKCPKCEVLKDYVIKLESDINSTNKTVMEMYLETERYEDKLNNLQKLTEEDYNANRILETSIDLLKLKLNMLEAKCSVQSDRYDSVDEYTNQVQLESEYVSVSTQAEVPCRDCERRQSSLQHKSLRRYFWEPLKCLFQVFAVICFLCAVSVLYGVTRRRGARCEREPVPWSWLDAQELIDLLLRIEYVAEVPM